MINHSGMICIKYEPGWQSSISSTPSSQDSLSVLRVYQDIIAEDVIVGELLAPGGDNQVVTPAEMIT